MDEPVFRVQNLSVHFPLAQPFWDVIRGREKRIVRAVDGVSFDIAKGEILSLVGESGSGKSTIGRALTNLIDPRDVHGSVVFEGKDMLHLTAAEKAVFRQRVQMIFQDPYQSLDPKQTNYYTVAEPLLVNHLEKDKAALRERVTQAIEQMGLHPGKDYLYRYPHELSGGQRQRIAIAAAMVLNPDFIVADEPVSMLDVSVRADILKLIVGLRDTQGISCLFITHDLSLAWLISDRIAIMYLGRIMELGGAEEIINHPLNPYSRALLEVMPRLTPRHGKPRKVLKGEIPSPTAVIPGCRFCTRCPLAREKCRTEAPQMRELYPGHFVACHFPAERGE